MGKSLYLLTTIYSVYLQLVISPFLTTLSNSFHLCVVYVVKVTSADSHLLGHYLLAIIYWKFGKTLSESIFHKTSCQKCHSNNVYKFSKEINMIYDKLLYEWYQYHATEYYLPVRAFVSKLFYKNYLACWSLWHVWASLLSQLSSSSANNQQSTTGSLWGYKSLDRSLFGPFPVFNLPLHSRPAVTLFSTLLFGGLYLMASSLFLFPFWWPLHPRPALSHFQQSLLSRHLSKDYTQPLLQMMGPVLAAWR